MGAVTNGLLKFPFKPLQAARERQTETGGRSWSPGKVFKACHRRQSCHGVLLLIQGAGLRGDTYTHKHTHSLTETPTFILLSDSHFVSPSLSARGHSLIQNYKKKRGHGHSWYISATYYSGVQQQVWDIFNRGPCCVWSRAFSISFLISFPHF